jgi:hypothetical protein
LSSTKDLPYAHFDAETFIESNERVIYFKSQIKYDLNNNDYASARKKTGQILHTIQDFYSHSNWVESGAKDIKKNIGTAQFNKEKMVTINDSMICSDFNSTRQTCRLVQENCTTLVSVFGSLLDFIGLKGTLANCPLEYFNCTDNLIILDKLVSGYYSGQRLPNGKPYDKPNQLGKCSHGGILDGSSFVAAEGGINKDSGYLVFSPHAYLHKSAANLAIKHTKYFFDEIRKDIGDSEFDNFLELSIDKKTLDVISDSTCSSSIRKVNQTIVLLFVSLCLYLK